MTVRGFFGWMKGNWGKLAVFVLLFALLFMPFLVKVVAKLGSMVPGVGKLWQKEEEALAKTSAAAPAGKAPDAAG
jgi:hypothetical protein